MKAAAFAYARATSIDDAVQLLAAHGAKAKIIAGGQSLMPAMNLRLISPELIIDVGRLEELRGISLLGGGLRIGALTRHADLLNSREVAKHAPLLTEAAAHIAHPAIRNRGTIGGSLAHADPAAELPACMLALDATMVVRGQNGELRISAVDFFKGVFETALSASDLLIAVELPVATGRSLHFFHEYSRRRGDYALAGLAANARRDGERLTALRLAFFAVGDRPVSVRASRKLINVAMTRELVSAASTELGEELDFQDDQQASGEMRRHLAQLLLGRCVSQFLGRADLCAGETGV
jgi:aerobic carbon-monoxide dehydrogenase medium subunit